MLFFCVPDQHLAKLFKGAAASWTTKNIFQILPSAGEGQEALT